MSDSPVRPTTPIAPKLFVRQDRMLVLSSLFRILNHNADYEEKPETYSDIDPKTGKIKTMVVPKRKSRTVSYQIEDNSVITFRCFEALDEKDAMVLCAIGALASANLGKEIPLDPDSQSPDEQVAMRKLDHNNLPMNAEKRRIPYTVQTSLRHLASMLGIGTGGDSLRSIQRSIDRLSRVHATWKVADCGGNLQTVTFNLLHHAARQNKGAYDARLSVSINAFTAQAFLGGKGSHTRIDIEDLEALGKKSSFAKLLHYRLCDHIRKGDDAVLKIDTLGGYLWSDFETMEQLSRERRIAKRKAIRTAMEDLAGLGWRSEEVTTKAGERALHIFRP